MKQLIKKFEITVIIENLYKIPEKEFVLSEPVTLNEPVTVQKKKKNQLTFMCNFQGFSQNFQNTFSERKEIYESSYCEVFPP